MYADTENYYIQAPKKNIYLIIDKDNNTLDFIERCVKEFGALHSTNETHTFEMCREHYGKKERVYISQLLLGYYQNRKHRKSERVLHLDGNRLNCKRDNLIGCDEPLRLNRRSVTISFDKDYIYILHKPTGVRFVANYEPELLRLIGSKRISWNLRNSKNCIGGKDYNRLVGEVFYHNKKCKNMSTSLSEVVYGYYHYNVRVNNITSALRKMKKELRGKNFVIEHLIADELNNTKANLSLVNDITNSKKRVIDRKIQPPYYLIMAYKDGVYKAVYCFGCYVAPVITANGIESLLEQLKSVLSIDVFGEYKSALQWQKDSEIKKYNLPDNYKIQKYMYDNFDNELLDIMVGEYIQMLYR